MVFINDSLTVVLAGDWNKLYIQPEWIAEHVFEKKEIEIGVNGQGSDFILSYRSDGVIISPGQSNMIFSVIGTGKEILEHLSKYLNNFIKKASTPQPYSYGLNIDFIEEDSSLFAEIVDSMSDTSAIIESGYEILTTKIGRTLQYKDKIVNMDFSLENHYLNVHFNEHHEKSTSDFCTEEIEGFIKECSRFLHGLGYELEGEELW